MFHLDFMLPIIGIGTNIIFDFIKKFRQPLIEGDFLPQLSQGVIVEALEDPFSGVGEDVVEVDRV